MKVVFLFFICLNVFAYPVGVKSSNMTTKYPALIDLGFLKSTQTGSTTQVTSLGASVADSLVLGGSLNASAILDVQSTSKGFLTPRMTTAQKNAISSPAAGLVVYDTTTNLLYFYTGSSWQTSSGLPTYIPLVPGISSGGVDIFSVSYGTTNATTPCSASPCSYIDQIGNGASSITRSSSGNYTINFSKTFTKAKCTLVVGSPSVTNMAINNSNLSCSSCSSISWNTVNGAAVSADSFGTIDCKGLY